MELTTNVSLKEGLPIARGS